MMTKERSIKMIKLMTHRAGIFILGHDHISQNSEYTLFSTISINSTLFDIVLRDYNAVFLCHC